MKERPILFSGPMVRALLAGTKTQTRRIVKPQPFANNTYHRGDVAAHENIMRSTGDPVCFNFGVTAIDGEGGLIDAIECPYGCPGDRLWVRENFYCDHVHYPEGCPISVRWREVDGQRVAIPTDEQRAEMRHLTYFQADGDPGFEEGGKVRWRPSIHMPRWLSRITLEITGVRVERLKEISDADAIAEGIGRMLCDCSRDGVRRQVCPHSAFGTHFVDYSEKHSASCVKPTFSYFTLWESINGPGSWAANPWVWCLSFRVAKS